MKQISTISKPSEIFKKNTGKICNSLLICNMMYCVLNLLHNGSKIIFTIQLLLCYSLKICRYTIKLFFKENIENIFHARDADYV